MVFNTSGLINENVGNSPNFSANRQEPAYRRNQTEIVCKSMSYQKTENRNSFVRASNNTNRNAKNKVRAPVITLNLGGGGNGSDSKKRVPDRNSIPFTIVTTSNDRHSF